MIVEVAILVDSHDTEDKVVHALRIHAALGGYPKNKWLLRIYPLIVIPAGIRIRLLLNCVSLPCREVDPDRYQRIMRNTWMSRMDIGGRYIDVVTGEENAPTIQP